MSELTAEKKERINNQLKYIRDTKIKDLQQTIDFYRKVGARKDMAHLLADMQDLQRSEKNYQNLLDNGPQKHEGLKVRVTEHRGNLVIETIDTEVFDEDFTPNGQGRIGCSLTNNARLGISKEALELMQTFGRVGDVIGDLMGEANEFTWIGGPMRIAQKDSKVCRYFKMPVGFKAIDNDTPKGIVEHIDNKSTGSVAIEYADFEQELWIELSKSGQWKPKADNKELQEHVYDDYYTLQNYEGARFVGGRVSDPDIVILNAPEGMVVKKEDSRTVNMSKDIEREILKACVDIFKKEGESGRDIKVFDNEIMSYINPLFDLGFDNNVMNPRDGYWRMSISATPKIMLEKLRAFKKEETLST